MEVHGDLGGWAPGNEPSRLPEGIGRSLPRKADVIMQVHYHPDGKPETDRSRIGLHFARTPIKQTLHWGFAANLGMELPPGQSDIEIKAKWTVPVDLEARAVTPHMHMLGRKMSMSITYPDGRTQDLVKIDDWDFGWQNTYYFEEPIDLPKDSVVHVVAHYDNSAQNPRNPNTPPKLVKWGEATTDEMCIGFIAVTKKGQDLTQPGEKDDLHDIFQKQEQGAPREVREGEREASQEGRSTPGGLNLGTIRRPVVRSRPIRRRRERHGPSDRLSPGRETAVNSSRVPGDRPVPCGRTADRRAWA